MWGLLLFFITVVAVFLFYTSFYLLHALMTILWPIFIFVLVMNYILSVVFDLSKKKRCYMIGGLFFMIICLFLTFLTMAS